MLWACSSQLKMQNDYFDLTVVCFCSENQMILFVLHQEVFFFLVLDSRRLSIAVMLKNLSFSFLCWPWFDIIAISSIFKGISFRILVGWWFLYKLSNCFCSSNLSSYWYAIPMQHLDRPGVSYCCRTTYDDNAITNAVEIYRSPRFFSWFLFLHLLTVSESFFLCGAFFIVVIFDKFYLFIYFLKFKETFLALLC